MDPAAIRRGAVGRHAAAPPPVIDRGCGAGGPVGAACPPPGGGPVNAAWMRGIGRPDRWADGAAGPPPAEEADGRAAAEAAMRARYERIRRELADASVEHLEAWLQAGRRTAVDPRAPERVRAAAQTQAEACRALLARRSHSAGPG